MPDVWESMQLLYQDSKENREWLREYDENCEPHEEDKMVDATKYAKSESSFLAARDFVGQNLKATIESVEEREFEARDGREAESALFLSFVGKDKVLRLNKSNTLILIEAYGGDTDSWVSHEIGLSVREYKDFAPGWIVAPLDTAPTEFNDDIPF